MLALVYVAAGKFGLSLAFVNPSATAIWPPTGLALAACLLLGGWVWPGIFLGALVVNFSASGHLPASLAIAFGNTLEGVVGAYLIQRYAQGARAFDRSAGVLAIAILAALTATALAATLGTTSLALSGLAAWADYGPIWVTWWLGDMSGALIVAPFLLVWARPEMLPRRRSWEAVALLACVLFGALMVFGGRLPISTANYPVSYAVLPLIVWAAFRFGPQGAATATLLLSGIALWGTLQGFGPFYRGSPNESLLLLQGFMGIVAVTGLGLAAVMADANRSFEAARAARTAAEQTSDHMRRLQAVTEALLPLLPAARVAEIVIQHAVELLSAAAGSVALLVDNETLEVIHGTGYPADVLEAFRRFPLVANVPLAEASRLGQPIWLESTEAWRAQYPHLLPAHTAVGTAAAAAIPILGSAGQVLGALGLSFATARSFAAEERALILTLTGQCAQALERARLYQSTQALNQQLEDRVGQRTAELAHSLSLLQATLDSTADGLLVVDSAGRITRYNERFASMWRLPPEIMAAGDDREAQAFVLSQLREPEAFLRKIQELYANPEAESFDVLAFKDGRVFERFSRPQRVEGQITGRVWSFRDVTDRLRAEAALAQERDLLQALMSNIPDTIYFKDKDSRFTRINPAQAHVLGVDSPEAAVGKTDADFQPPELAESFLAEERQITRSGEPVVDRVEFNPTPDGQPRWFSATKVPLRDPSGQVVGLVGISRDVTARMQMEAALRQSHEQLQALTARLQSIREDERARFAYTLHDQLGQELSGLKMDVAWLQRNLEHADPSALVEKAKAMGTLLDMCIQTVRHMTTELRPSLLDDFGLAAAIEWQLREFQAQTGLDSRLVNAPAAVPLNPEASTVVFRIFQDILENVRQHAQAKRVEVKLSHQNGQVNLRVRDNGRGISPEELHSPQSLGLRSMHERARRLGGQVDIQGAPGEGTVVSVRVPVSVNPPRPSE